MRWRVPDPPRPTYVYAVDKVQPAKLRVEGRRHMRRRAVLLADRDGVLKSSRFLNTDKKADAEAVMLPSAMEAARTLHAHDVALVIVTNQGGYQSGSMSFEDTLGSNVRVAQQVANAGGHINAVLICPFMTGLVDARPGVLDARKPSPAMPLFVEAMARARRIPVLGMVGDQRTDGGAAQAAGMKFFAVTGGDGRWAAERNEAFLKGHALPELDVSSERYAEVNEFAGAVKALLRGD